MMTPRTVAIASSPGRAEKLPAPPGLARLFIRKSRSRAGVRASPMFGVRSRSVGPTGRTNGTEGEEPSSPKVTCIGQVRIKAGKKNKKRKPKPSSGVKCRCLQRALFCATVSEKKKKKKKKNDMMAPRRIWPCWGMSSCHKVSFCGKRKEVDKEVDRVVALGLAGIPENGVRSEVRQKDEEPSRLSNFTSEPGRLSNYNEEPARSSNYARRSISGLEEVSDQEEGVEGDEKKEREDEKEYVSSATTTPPKNALLLMRCRSAPQHHNRFAPSPITLGNETMDVVGVEKVEKGIGMITEKKEEEEEKRVESQKGSSTEGEEEEEEEEEEMRCSSARPLVLTRCKSEPASKGETVMASVGPDMASTSCFWAHTGSGSRQRKMVLGLGLEQRTASPLSSH
jgi:hypothetical protein